MHYSVGTLVANGEADIHAYKNISNLPVAKGFKPSIVSFPVIARIGIGTTVGMSTVATFRDVTEESLSLKTF
jgi:hypothetical protein